MSRYLASQIFQNVLKRATGIVNNPVKISELLSSVTSKISDMEGNKKRVSEFMYKVKTMVRMLRAYISGEYRNIPWKSLVMIIGSLIYFMMPLDIIPDFIPATGLADDISIILLVFNSVNEDINAFLEYEQSTVTEINDEGEFS
jgi:uncharacterized membrane protein YkvA (DUF1232 family)